MSFPDHLKYGAAPAASMLRDWLADCQQRTLALFAHWQALGQAMPRLEIVNPPHWEFGHVAWFHEFWVHRRGDAGRPSRIANADALFNSAIVPHATRWDLPLPPPQAIRDYLAGVFEDTRRLLQDEPEAADAYFIQLAIFHQDMHNEAFAYSWQTADWPWPADVPPYVPPYAPACAQAPEPPQDDLCFDAAVVDAGSRPGAGFAFDNEKWSHPVHVDAFAIARAPVTQREYLEYVEGDPAARTPRHWRCEGGRWSRRVHQHWLPLAPDEPVCHVSAQEAEAWCRWRGRRLPTEFEWLRLALAQPQLAFAGVWEWTSSPFAPFPGFRADPYAEYSAPWFDGRYRVLKGASRWTPPRLVRAGFRNFYLPSRSDLFCGFRTCAADSR